MAKVNDGGASFQQIRQLSQTISDFKTSATGKGASADQLKAQAAAIKGQVDSMQAAGVLTYSDAQKLSTTLSSMGDIAGEKGHSHDWNNLSGQVGALMNSLTSGGEGATGLRMNTDTKEAQAQLTGMMGAALQDGKYNDFANFLGKNGISVSSSGSGNAAGSMGVNSGDQLAGALNKLNMQVYSDASGNTVVYSAQTRTGAAFTKDGTSIAVPSDFTKGGLEQKTPYTFSVGGMTVSFGGQTDTKGNVYGLDIANT